MSGIVQSANADTGADADTHANIDTNTDTNTPSPPPLAQILWQCRRGGRELELQLSTFATAQYHDLTRTEQLAFAQLLTYEDPRLTAWLGQHEPPPTTELVNLVLRILSAASPPPAPHRVA